MPDKIQTVASLFSFYAVIDQIYGSPFDVILLGKTHSELYNCHTI